MNPFFKYFSGIYTALKSLIGGMIVTWKELWTKKVTMQYPENRKTLQISDRWRSELTMPHDNNNEHSCTACGICMINCPNGTINVISKTIETEEGKKKKILDKHVWDYGMCTFCNLCVITCPSDAIVFNNDFEGAMYDRSKLVRQLNKPGSKLKEKKRETPKVAAPSPSGAPKADIKQPATNTVAPAEPVSKPVAEKKGVQIEKNEVAALKKTAQAVKPEVIAEKKVEKTAENLQAQSNTVSKPEKPENETKNK